MDVSKNMRMAPDQLLRDGGDDLLHGKAACLFCQFSIKDDRVEQIAELLDNFRIVVEIDSFDDLVRLFENIRLKRLKGLFLIPRTPLGPNRVSATFNNASNGSIILTN